MIVALGLILWLVLQPILAIGTASSRLCDNDPVRWMSFIASHGIGRDICAAWEARQGLQLDTIDHAAATAEALERLMDGCAGRKWSNLAVPAYGNASSLVYGIQLASDWAETRDLELHAEIASEGIATFLGNIDVFRDGTAYLFTSSYHSLADLAEEARGIRDAYDSHGPLSRMILNGINDFAPRRWTPSGAFARGFAESTEKLVPLVQQQMEQLDDMLDLLASVAKNLDAFRKSLDRELMKNAGKCAKYNQMYSTNYGIFRSVPLSLGIAQSFQGACERGKVPDICCSSGPLRKTAEEVSRKVQTMTEEVQKTQKDMGVYHKHLIGLNGRVSGKLHFARVDATVAGLQQSFGSIEKKYWEFMGAPVQALRELNGP
ncbi:uncharacterized protein LTR77_009158 [Saxophila tyrrhenica]|uniref:Uncharacterized protein n=1 Tax=Saxophila tyrrhenica TaxID=1690608 RepID=A0AAV9NZA2_9PEZI|nr:hypothetical protein LTR77_009158 [Saxophila tyrrhenica]